MRGNSIVLHIFVLIGLLCSSQAKAASVCVLDPGSQAHDLKPFMEFLEDPGGKLTIEDVASESMASRFRRPPTGHFNFGFTSSALWFRFTVVEPVPAGQGFDAQRDFGFSIRAGIFTTHSIFSFRKPRPPVAGKNIPPDA